MSCVPIILALLSCFLIYYLYCRRSDDKESFLWNKTLFNAVTEAIFIHDAHTGQILDVNDYSEELFGYDKNTIMNMSIEELSSGAEGYRQQDALRYLMKTLNGEPQRFEWESKDSEGKVFFTEINMRSFTYASQELVLVSGRDISNRKRIELERDRIFSLSIDMLCSVSYNGAFLLTNPSWSDTLGWSHDELLSMTWNDLVHGDDRAVFDVAVDRVKDGDPVCGVENRCRCRDGSFRWLSWDLQPLKDEETIFGVVRDVTERIAKNEELVWREQMFRNVLSSAPVGMYLYTIDEYGGLRLTDANDKAYELTGVDAAQSVGEKMEDIFPGLSDSEIPEKYRNVALTGQSYELKNVAYTTPDRDYCNYYDVCAFQTSYKNLCVMFHDVTSLVNSKNSFEENEGKLSVILNSIGDGVVACDLESRIMWFNPAVLHIAGIINTEITGKYLGEVFFVVNGNKDSFKPLILPDIDSHKDVHQVWESVLVTPSGDERVISCTSNFLRDVDGEISGTVLVIRDITERRRMKELVVQAEKMSSVGVLAAGMAHEINNPLGIIMQAAQNLQRRLAPDFSKNTDIAQNLGLDLDLVNTYMNKRNIYGFTKQITEAGRRAAKIVKNMLMFSRKNGSEIGSYDITTLIDKAFELVRTEYGIIGKYDLERIDILREYEDELPLIKCCSIEIEQVFVNLFKNAIQESVRLVAEGHVLELTIRVLIEKRFVRIDISDNGNGIPPEIMNRIFEPFFTTRTVGCGTGLGLAISYMIITQNHGGSIEVESELGEGASFIVRLPL